MVRFIYKIIFNYIYLVIGLAANKCDLIENEQVPEEKAREFAKEIGAIFDIEIRGKYFSATVIETPFYKR